MNGLEEAKPKQRTGLALLLLLPVLVVALGWTLWQLDAALLGRILAGTDAALARVGTVLLFGIVPGVVVAVLIYPPAIPLLRLYFSRLKAKASFDRKAARDLIQRLSDFESVRDLQSLGELYVEGGLPTLAVPPLARAQELEPENPRIHYLIARCLRELRRPKEAFAAVEASLRMDPSIAFGAGLLLAAELGLRVGAHEHALMRAREHEQKFGESISGLFAQARAAQGLGDGEIRRKAFARLLELPPGKGKHYRPEEAYARARAKMARLPRRSP